MVWVSRFLPVLLLGPEFEIRRMWAPYHVPRAAFSITADVHLPELGAQQCQDGSQQLLSRFHKTPSVIGNSATCGYGSSEWRDDG